MRLIIDFDRIKHNIMGFSLVNLKNALLKSNPEVIWVISLYIIQLIYKKIKQKYSYKETQKISDLVRNKYIYIEGKVTI